ncbi:hypothetical protein KGF54_001252 [Candida jiufengensis]|uniref:uncharacterized protein n=1 Tax=Candida jiufengensis TaxID=497108 RepID=UPI002225451E|nr:uncharacterized protein KGF54_001252 [Candida jiufengensis]KAI5955750.1 hypothetical protein KGF54_001252 [Candida jiufengensis]
MKMMSIKTLGPNNLIKSIFSKQNELTKSAATILDFKNSPQESLDNIITRSDKEIGGFSTVNFQYDENEKCGQFSGNLSLDLPKNNPQITRSGYAMFRTKDQSQSWLNGDKYWDWSNFNNLVMRVKGDRRKYLVNIQANTPLVTDLFQHRLFLNNPGHWETVIIPLNDFVMTNWGVIQDGSELNKSEIKTIGIGLLDKQYGPFSLKIDTIKVMTGGQILQDNEHSHQDKLNILEEENNNSFNDDGGALGRNTYYKKD